MLSKAPTQTIDWPTVLVGVLTLFVGGATGLLVTNTPSTLKIIVILLGLFFVLATLIRPEWGLIGLIIINYTNLSDIAIKYHGAPSIAQPFVALVVGSIVLHWMLRGERPVGWKVPLILVGLYTLSGLGSLLYALDIARAQAAMTDYFKYPITTLLVVILLQRGVHFKQAIWALIFVGIFLGSITSYQYMTGTFQNSYGGFAIKPFVNISETGESQNRVTGPIGDPNFYAQTILVLVPLGIERVLNSRSRIMRLLAAWSVAACFLTLLGTLSRGAFLGLGVVIVMMMLRHPPKPAILVSLIVAAVVLFPFIPERYTARLSTITGAVTGPDTSGFQDHSIVGRSSEMTAAVLMFVDHPFVGVGIGNYNAYYLQYSRLLGWDSRREERSAHNLYLEIAAERGIIGLIIFLTLIVLMFRTMLRSRNTLLAAGFTEYGSMIDALMIGMVSYMVTSFFLHDAYPRYFWLLVGIAFASAKVAQNELAAQRKLRNQVDNSSIPGTPSIALGTSAAHSV